MHKLAIIITASISILFLGTVAHAETTQDTKVLKEQNEHYIEGQKLLSTHVDEDTGVRVDVFTVPSSNTFRTLSSNGSWNVLDGEQWVMNGNFYDIRTDGVYYSTGGDYSFVIPPHEVDYYDHSFLRAFTMVTLHEYDPASDDEKVATYPQEPVNYPNVHIAFRDIDRFVDGTNDKAEFYTTHRTNYTVLNQVLYVEYYD